MCDPPGLLEALRGIPSRLDAAASGEDVAEAFLAEGVYDLLGYEASEADVRHRFAPPDVRGPDCVTLDATEAVTAVYEFEAIGGEFASAPTEARLFEYMDGLEADYGVLTDGETVRLYRGRDRVRSLTVGLAEVTESAAADIANALRNPAWDVTDPECLAAALDRVATTGADDGRPKAGVDSRLGRYRFFETFRLEAGSPVADLATAMADLFAERREEGADERSERAYDTWTATHAGGPENVPDSWSELMASDGPSGSLREFAFCVESTQALLSRLLVAETAADYDFPGDVGEIRRYVGELGGRDGDVTPDAYPAMAARVLEDAREQLRGRAFEAGVFDWWVDGYRGRTDAEDRTSAGVCSRTPDGVCSRTRERFGRALARVLAAVAQFDLSTVRGDPLGELYQRCFDPETRKALGEFYTPQPIVEYVMDGVDYGVGISEDRIVDPACGSGAFLIEAVDRYLEDVRRSETDPDWPGRLETLCTGPRVVGLDINPFAVLLARARFLLTIMPAYREAKRQRDGFTIPRSPIFRTDTLHDERGSPGRDAGEGGRATPREVAAGSEGLETESKGSRAESEGPRAESEGPRAESEGSRAESGGPGTVREGDRDVRIPVSPTGSGDTGRGDGSTHEGGAAAVRGRIPTYETVRADVGIGSVEEYYAVLQGVLDVVKRHARTGTRTYEGGLEAAIGRYATQTREGTEAFFEPYVDDALATIRRLGDGSDAGGAFEDAALAFLAKNYLRYDYVVGNPPYVRVQRIPDAQKARIDPLYRSAVGAYDLYYLFYERGIDMLAAGGRLGYVTPSQFMSAEDGAALRTVIRTRTTIEEVFDFRGAGVFEDAMTYPAIVLLRRDGDASDGGISCIRVRAEYEAAPEDLGERIVRAARDHRGGGRYSGRDIDAFRVPQSALDDDNWTLMPPAEHEVFETLERNAAGSVGEITDSVFQGLRTGANGVFVVEPLDADRIDPKEGGETVRVRSTGSERTFEIESDLLCPWVERGAFRRWEADWDGKHLLMPYGRDTELLSAETLAESFPLTWAYLESHRETLERREGGAYRDTETWYRFARPQNVERFGRPKLVGKEFADSAQFMPDDGRWHFASGYGISLADGRVGANGSDALTGGGIDLLAGCVNSAVAEYYLKHIAPIKSFSPVEAYYAYRARYVDQLPLPFVPDDWLDGPQSDPDSRIEDVLAGVETVRGTLRAETRTRRFPEAYLDGFEGDLGYIEHEWQTRRRPVDAGIEERDLDGPPGRFAVTAGRSDEISHPLMNGGDRQERRMRARYVRAAVDGRTVRKGETRAIPIPHSRGGVDALLGALADDRRTVETTDVDALEAEIDRAIYGLFGLTTEERTVIEDYLGAF